MRTSSIHWQPKNETPSEKKLVRQKSVGRYMEQFRTYADSDKVSKMSGNLFVIFFIYKMEDNPIFNLASALKKQDLKYVLNFME